MFDSDLGMYYLGARWYDPETARFLNGDSYVSTGQDLTGYNMFAYCGNNPINRADPDGEFWGLVFTIITVVAAVAVLSNHIVNKVNITKAQKQRIDYTVEEAKKDIDKILDKYETKEEEKIEIEFNDNGAEITNSYKVTSRYDRQLISQIIADTGKTNRSVSSLSAEWEGHNICKALGIQEEPAMDAFLDYQGDGRPLVRFAIHCLQIIGVN